MTNLNHVLLEFFFPRDLEINKLSRRPIPNATIWIHTVDM